jgi:hypothetical protein
MDWRSIYQVTLATKASFSKYAKVVIGRGNFQNNGKSGTFTITRIELRVISHNGENSGLGIAFSGSEFDWLVSNLKVRAEKSAYYGKRILLLNRLQDGTYTITTSENDRVFGITMCEEEVTALLKNEKHLKFVMKYHKCSNELLHKLVTTLFVITVGRYINKLIKNDCEACKTNLPHDDDDIQYCQKYLRDLLKSKDYIDIALGDAMIENEFMKRYDKICSLLEISSSCRIECLQLVVVALKENKQQLKQELTDYRDIHCSHSNELCSILEKLETYPTST